MLSNSLENIIAGLSTFYDRAAAVLRRRRCGVAVLVQALRVSLCSRSFIKQGRADEIMYCNFNS